MTCFPLYVSKQDSLSWYLTAFRLQTPIWRADFGSEVSSLIYRSLERLIPATEGGHGAHRLRCRFPVIPGACATGEMRCCEIFDCPSLSSALSLVRVHALCDALYPSWAVAVTTRASTHTTLSIPAAFLCVTYSSDGHTHHHHCSGAAKNQGWMLYVIWYDTFDFSPSSRTRSSSVLHQNDVRAF